LATNFAAQWLELKSLDDVMPDADRFGQFDGKLRKSMRRETEMLFEAVRRERRPVRDLLDPGFTFLNDRLAEHYGIAGIEGSELRRVALPQGPRGGLLGHASILTLTSNPTRTSPVKRGKWILENLLDAPPPPPPPGVGALDERKEAVASAPIRERLARHRTDPSCASCHARMDALGFALENFDAIGRWRETDGEFPIDPSGILPDGRTFAGPEDLRRLLGSGDALVRCLLKKLFIYALGRGLADPDVAAIDALVASLPENPTLEDLILGIVSLDAFRLRRASG
jgi:hypothetical protein